MCKTKWQYIIMYIIATYLIIFHSLWFIILLVLTLIFDMIDAGIEAMQCEQDYIWRMNDGPSTMGRVRFLKDNKTGTVRILSWKGGANGYYECGDKKYDRYLEEIK